MSKAFSGLTSASKTLSGVAASGSGGSSSNIDGGAAGEVVYQDGVSSTTFTNAADGVLQSDAVTPYFGALSLSGTRVSGILPLTKGGTGSSTLTGITGTGLIVANNTPTLITPVLGAATGTSLNLSGLTATRPVVTDGSNNLASASITGTAGSAVVLQTSPTLTTPNIGAATGTSLTTGNTVIATAGITTQTALGTPLIDTTASTDASFIDFKNTLGLNHVFIGKGNAATPGIGSAVDGCAVVWSNAKPVDIIAGNTASLTAKTDGTLKFYQHTSATALNTDASGNVGSASINGSGNLVGTTNAALVTPNIGVAAGTSLNLSGLTATRPVVTDGSNNLASASITGTAGSAVVLQTSPTLTTPNIGAATATSITGSAAVDLDISQLTTTKRIKLSTLDTSIQMYKGATLVGDFDTIGSQLAESLTITGAAKALYAGNNQIDGTGQGQYLNVATDDNTAFYAETASGKYINSQYTDTTNTVTVGQNATGHAEISTATSKDFIVKPNSTIQFRVKSGGVIQMPNYASKRVLATDVSGNLEEPTINGTGNLVATTSAALTTPNIGAANGTSLQLSGLTASATVLQTDGSKNITSLITPKMSAYLGTNQTGVSGLVEVNIDTESFDIGSYFDTTGHRYTPLVAGYYAVAARLETTAVSAIVQALVYKNGTDVVAGNGSRSGAGSGTFQTGCSGFTYMNGSTDYLEMFIYTASSTDIISGASSTVFSAYMVV